MLFQDTNMGAGVYARMDGSTGIGRNKGRDVTRAIEELIGHPFDESSLFSDLAKEYLIMHFPNCNGLTVLEKYERKT